MQQGKVDDGYLSSSETTPAVSDITASFDADTQSGAIALSSSGGSPTTCTISNLSHVSVTQACSCAGKSCSLKVTGDTHYSGSASFSFVLGNSVGSSKTGTATLTINPVTSLALDFTTGTLPSSVTFSRTGIATRYNASGTLEEVASSTARFDYDPTQANCPSNVCSIRGLLVEEGRENYLKMATDLTNSNVWTLLSNLTSVATATVGPDGTATAATIADADATAKSSLRQSSTSANGETWTASAYILKDTTTSRYPSVSLRYAGGTSLTYTAVINSQTGAIWASSSATSSTIGIQDVGSYWRVWVTGANNSTGNTTVYIYVSPAQESTVGGNENSATGSVVVWGPQLEKGTGVTSYIPAKSPLTYSEQFDNAAWTKSAGTISANAYTAPDGTTTADKIVKDGTNSASYVQQTATMLPTQNLTYTLYARASDYSKIRLSIFASGQSSEVWAVYTLSGTGAVYSSGETDSASNATLGSASISAVGTDGWYRCVLVGQPGSAGTNAFVRAYPADSSGTVTFTGSGGVYIWGSQIEIGSTATNYVTRTTGSVRNAETALVSTLGSWFDSAAGSAFTEVKLLGAPQSGLLASTFAFTDGTTNNLINQYYTSTGAVQRAVTGGATQTDATVAFTPSGTSRLASTYQSNDLHIAQNGTLGTASTSCTLPTVTNLYLGSSGSTNYLNSWLRKFEYYPTRLTNSKLTTISQ